MKLSIVDGTFKEVVVSNLKNFAIIVVLSICIGVANGLDALILILRAYQELGIMSAGDEVIVPANTYIQVS